MRSLAELPIKGEKNLVVGELDNGFRYVILPNKLPPKRFEAHLEVHAGSVDELEHEQGVAHLVEHVTFLGSKRREALLGTGARANAYTDFHHTVFHVHAPAYNSTTGGPMVQQVLEALEEIAFKPEFLPMRIEKERKAVLAEAQMMNTIEYRVDCQLLQYLHEENNLGCRFPIGKMEQVKTWAYDTLRSFWEKWYFPANATLYVVGDLDRDVEATRKLIQDTFGRLPPAREPPPPGAAADVASTSAAATNGNGNGHASPSHPQQQAAAAAAQGPIKRRHSVRPPVVHRYGFGPLGPSEKPAEVKIFRHPLLQQFMLSVFCKLPIDPMTKMDHLKRLFLMRILLSVFQFRINSRYVQGEPRFTGIELDISDSGREGCAVSTITITSEPRDWRGAVQVAVQEARRLQRHGLTPGEFERYREAILRDSAQLAGQANKIPSLDTLNFLMESLACAHTIMGHEDAHEAMQQVASLATLEEMNALVRSMLSFMSDYENEAEVLAQAEAQPFLFTHLGPTRTTSIVACIPAYMDASGQSVAAGGSGGMKRDAAALGAAGHIDADQIDLAELEEQSRQTDEFEVPEGAIKFDLAPEEIAAALAERDLDVTAPADVELPRQLMKPAEVEELVLERQPRWVPLAGEGGAGPARPAPDASSGIVQRRLSNGMRVNFRHTDNESQSCLLRIIANGGRAAEQSHTGPDGFGAVVVGTRVLSESGTVGHWKREAVEAFCVANLIHCALEADEENVVMDFHFAVGDGGMESVFQLAHLFLEQPVWEESAVGRAKQSILSAGRSVMKSLERATSNRIMNTMLGPKRLFRDPTPEEIEALTLDGMRGAVQTLLHTDNLEVNVVGDFDQEELESCLLRYMGTIRPRPDFAAEAAKRLAHQPLHFLSPPRSERHTAWHLADSDERAVAYIAGPAPARWGPLGSFEPLERIAAEDVRPPPAVVPALASAEDKKRAAELRRAHPLYAAVVQMLLTEIINSRLFTTVRDSLGLTYDVSFEMPLFDRTRAGWFSVHVTSHPDKIYDALNASVSVLRDLTMSPITRRELQRAKTTVVTRHESDLKDNVYWLGLITHLQNDRVPHKNVACMRDLKALYDAATVEDIYHAYQHFRLGDEQLFTCVGTSGRTPPPVPDVILRPMPYFDADMEDSGPGGAAAGGPGGAQQNMPANPMALFTAMMAAAQAMNLSEAFKKAKEQQQQQQDGSGRQQ